MRKEHSVSGFISPDGNEIVAYVHERHRVGECAWCDFCRSRAIAREFIGRMDECGQDVRNLNMWSLGTSLHDTEFNRKILKEKWSRFRNRLHKRGYRSIVFRVVEAGRRGYLHIHFVAISFIPHAVVLASWRALTGEASNVHVSGQKGAQDVKRLTKYLLKYLSKSSTDYRWCGPFYGLGRERGRSVRFGGDDRGSRPIYGGVTYLTHCTEQDINYGEDSEVQRSLPSS